MLAGTSSGFSGYSEEAVAGDCRDEISIRYVNKPNPAYKLGKNDGNGRQKFTDAGHDGGTSFPENDVFDRFMVIFYLINLYYNNLCGKSQ